MTASTNQTPPELLDDITDVLLEAERAGVTRKQMAIAAGGVTTKMVEAWMTGKRPLALARLRLMLQRGPLPLADLLITFITRDTAYRVQRGACVGTAGARAETRRVMRKGVDLMEEVDRALEGDGVIDGPELARIEGVANEVKLGIDRALSSCRECRPIRPAR